MIWSFVTEQHQVGASFSLLKLKSDSKDRDGIKRLGHNLAVSRYQRQRSLSEPKSKIISSAVMQHWFATNGWRRTPASTINSGTSLYLVGLFDTIPLYSLHKKKQTCFERASIQLHKLLGLLSRVLFLSQENRFLNGERNTPFKKRQQFAQNWAWSVVALKSTKKNPRGIKQSVT